jgi:hypothetical protein
VVLKVSVKRLVFVVEKLVLLEPVLRVWLVVEARQLGITESQLLQDYPHISASDLVNCWAYADAYSEQIATIILDNNE